MIERKQLESAATEYSYMRGLFMIPLGLLFFLSAAGNWGWGPAQHTWVFVGALLLVVAATFLINRYYQENYGRVILSTRQQVRAAIATAISLPLIFGASFLVRSRMDWSLHLPLNPTAASMALLMLTAYAVTVGLKAHHVIILGSLLVVGVLPIWRGPDPSNIGMVLAGIAFIATGIFDHLLLVRTLGSSGRSNLADGDVGA
jgi:hypothetical protein